MNPGRMLGLVLLVALVHIGPVESRDAWEPSPSDASYGYLSTALLMDPCGIESEGAPADEIAQRATDEARALLPEGTCDTPGMRELLFRTRLLQYTLIAELNEPWRVFDIVEAQRQVEALCQDVGCLRQLLVDAEERLQSMFDVAAKAPTRASMLCDAPQPLKAYESGNLLPESVLAMLERQCAGDFVLTSCDGERKLISAQCITRGISANAPEWLWRSTPTGSTQLLYSDEGPFLPLPSSCNAMADVMTSARASMGESHVTYYRYDGTSYQAVFSYIRESIGVSAIARYPEREASVICK